MFYIDLFNGLQRHQVQYLLIGGLAVSLHGVERTTMDIDITVAMQPENLNALIAMAQALKLSPVLPVPLNSLLDLNLLKQWHTERNLIAFALKTEEIAGVTIDILLFPPADFASMYSRAVIFDIANTPVKVAAIDDLIAMKSAVGRPIDLSDVRHLQNKTQMKQATNKPFDPAERTYEVSEERLRAYQALTPAQRFKWVEESAAFLRLARVSRENEFQDVKTSK